MEESKEACIARHEQWQYEDRQERELEHDFYYSSEIEIEDYDL